MIANYLGNEQVTLIVQKNFRAFSTKASGPIFASGDLVIFLQVLIFALVKNACHIAVLLLAVLLPMTAGAQSNHVRRAMERARDRQEAMARMQVNSENGRSSGGKLRMQVENGDTTYLDNLPPVFIISRGKRSNEKNWREYYKLVWRFATVYPYAQAAGVLIQQVDSTLNAEHYGIIRKDRYISALQKELFNDFEGIFRDMSIQQGTVMLKLINRETGVVPYDIIKNYKNGAAAGFWQAVAKLFDNDLKNPYDPEGADKELEELVQIWQRGEFPALYWSVFWEDPPTVNIPERYRK